MKKIFTWVISILTFIFFTISILLIILGVLSQTNNTRLKIFGYSYSVVASDSMEPTILVGDILITKDFPYGEVSVGDAIVFYSEDIDNYIVHRVVGINSDGSFKTKGDNRRYPEDPKPVTIDNFEGMVVSYGTFLGIGKLILDYRPIAFMLVVLIFVLIIINEIVSIIKLVREEKQKELIELRELTYNEERAKLKEELRKEYFPEDK